MKKIILYLTLLTLTVTSFIIFGIELNQLIEDAKVVPSIADSVYVNDSSFEIESDSEGSSFKGSIAFFESNITYDTIYDDDTTGDGYRDRRSYYLGNDIVFASWDENADFNYEVSMRISDGIYIDSQVLDMNNDGIIDTITTFTNDGEEIFTESDLMNIRGAEFRDNLYSREFSSEALFWVALPLISGIFLLIILIISLVKNKKAKRAISLLLCMSMMGLTMTIPGYASDLYNEDGSVNQEVFDKNWEKYSDIVPVIPLDQRSYEARKYGEAEQEIERLYSLMYQTAANQELNRLNYIDLVDYKKAVDTIHKKNLIKSTIRLAAFTGYTINDSIGKGKTFAVNILKSGATYVTQIGDVLTVTSDFVTESYKESFGVLQKAYKYTTSDNITKEILDDMKSDVKDKVSMKINDTIDEAIGRKRIPDYKVDDLKITKDDVQILKFFYEKSRELENAILQNRKVNTSYEKKIDNIVEKIQLEMNKLDKFKKAEKERLFYSLSKNPPENAPQDDEESIGILDENTPQEGEDYSDDSDDTWSDEIDIEEPIEDYNTDDLVGTWNGTSTIMEISSTLGLVDDDWMQLEQFIGQSEDVSVDIYKEGDIYIYKHGDLKMRLEQNGKNIHIDRGYFTESNEDVEMNLVADLTGEVNDLNSEMILDTVLRFDIETEENSGSIDLVLKMELFK